MIALFSIHFIHLSTSFLFRHKFQFIYFPIYLLFEAGARDLRFTLPESTTKQASNAARVRSQKAPDFQLF